MTLAWAGLKEPDRGSATGFKYRRRQNRRGEETVGIVLHVTLESIANARGPLAPNLA